MINAQRPAPSEEPEEFDKPEAVFMDVTPEMAEAWLVLNASNRSLSEHLVADHRRSIEAGGWLNNGETIKLSRGPVVRLLDGQHRLEAIRRSGITVHCLVVRGLDPKTQATIDIGRKRSAADQLTINGEANGHVVAAILRRVWLWDIGDRHWVTSPAPSPAELGRVLQEYPEIRRSAEVANTTYGKFKMLPKSALGTGHHLFSRVTKADEIDVVPEFFSRIGDGANLETGDPVLTLRNRAIRDRGTNVRFPAAQAMGYLVHAWNAYYLGTELTTMLHPLGNPIPELKKHG